MQSDLMARRRAISIVYRRFLDADRAWTEAVAQMNAWFPVANRPGYCAIGNPGSRMRRLYEQRAQAIAQLDVAVLKLKLAKGRMAKRRQLDLHHVALLGAP